MESGRSMVEMLGTLAVMGILSVGGIAMYNSAMVKHRANTLMTEAQKRAVVASAQIIMQGKPPNLAEFEPYNATEIGRFGEATKEGLSHQFGIKINYVEKDVCRALLNMIGDQTPIRRLSYPASPATPISGCDEVGNYLIVYNDDLSPKDQTEPDPIPEETQPQECEEDTDCQTVCGSCQIEAGSTKGVCVGECEIPVGSCTDNTDCNAENECMICDPATRTCKDGCERVEYLESQDMQKIDTNLNYFPDFEVGVKVDDNSFKNITLGSDVNNFFERFGADSPYWTLHASGTIFMSDIPVSTYVNAKYKNGVFSLNGTTYGEKSNPFPSGIMMLFRSPAGQNPYKMRIYFCKLWNRNSTLVRDFVPVIAPNGEACMYDKVSGQLFYNQGTGIFKTNKDNLS